MFYLPGRGQDKWRRFPKCTKTFPLGLVQIQIHPVTAKEKKRVEKVRRYIQ